MNTLHVSLGQHVSRCESNTCGGSSYTESTMSIVCRKFTRGAVYSRSKSLKPRGVSTRKIDHGKFFVTKKAVVVHDTKTKRVTLAAHQLARVAHTRRLIRLK